MNSPESQSGAAEIDIANRSLENGVSFLTDMELLRIGIFTGKVSLSLTAVVFVLAALAVFVVIAHPSERRKEGESE